MNNAILAMLGINQQDVEKARTVALSTIDRIEKVEEQLNRIENKLNQLLMEVDVK